MVMSTVRTVMAIIKMCHAVEHGVSGGPVGDRGREDYLDMT